MANRDSGAQEKHRCLPESTKPKGADTKTKVCSKCKQDKPFSEFTNRKKARNILERRCKSCEKERFKEYRARNKEKVRGKNFRDRYGIGVEEYEALKKQQDGKCSICETEGHVLYVDHCHHSGNIRGLLCQKCNSGIGMLQDSIMLLKKAVRYLEKHEKAPAKPKSVD